MGNTFTPPSRPLSKTILERLQPLFIALRQFTQGHELDEVVQERTRQREPIRRQLLNFENEITRYRKALAENRISIDGVIPQWAEWVRYGRKDFYIQLRLLYYKHGFYQDAERIDKIIEKGVKYTSTVQDEHGNTVGSETVTDNGRTTVKGNAVQLEF